MTITPTAIPNMPPNMELSGMSDTIIAALIALTSAFVGSLMGFLIARRNTKDQFFYAAGAKLKLAFRDELAFLTDPKWENSSFFHRRLETTFEKHFLAITEFRYALHKSQRDGFDKVWQEYYTTEDAPNDILLVKYSPELNPTGREDAIKNIEAILKFTEK